MTQRRRNATDRRGKNSAREAKGSVHEAIGKLIGDDAERAHGAAEQRAAKSDRKDPSSGD